MVLTAVREAPLSVDAATTYDVVIEHRRREPVDHRFRYTSRAALVDLDRLPRLPRGLRWLGSFEARDHVGDPHHSLHCNIEKVLASHNVDIAGGRVLMLANPRAFGYVFNPISIHWCYDAAGNLAAVIAEVHNTYGDRHAYVIVAGQVETVDSVVAKQLYVSPFNAVDGEYRIRVSPPGERVSVSVTLHRDGRPPFVATLVGHRHPAGSATAAAAATAFSSLRTTVRIRKHGIRLWRRGLHVEPRPHYMSPDSADREHTR